MALLQALPQVTGPTTPEFHRTDFEDPQRFLEDLQVYFTTLNVPVNSYVRLAGAALRSEAQRWWETYRTLNFGFERFRDLFLQRFNNPSVVGRLLTLLYSQKQGDREPGSVFLQKKIQLHQRLRRQEPEEAMVSAFLELLRPTLRQGIRAASPHGPSTPKRMRLTSPGCHS